MEFIEGVRLKDAVPKLSRKELDEVFTLLGREVGSLHSSGIMHGDLTTANIIRKVGHLVFLDFGLSIHSVRIEDHAVDLRLIKETLVGAHSRVASAAVASLVEGYRARVGSQRAKQVLHQLSSIERRGRYARVV
jgi:TP53 regulating kinase-like protein